MRSRREFFHQFAAAAALPASWTAFASALSAASGRLPGPPSPSDETYWQMVARQFALEPGLTYLNAANVCPASRPVMDRHLQFLRDFHANPSFQNREKYVPLRESLRSKLAAMFRVNADEIAIVRNTSEGSNIIVKGLNLKAGDEILITSHNHPSNNDSWKVRARRDGLVVTSLPVPVPASDTGSLVAAFEKAFSARTRVVAITHVTNTTGILYPARQITEAAHRRSIFVHLDGAQSFGALDVNLRDIGCDSYSASFHKWPMGPLEAGVLYLRSSHIPEVWPSIVTAGWSDNLRGARKFEVFGQRDDPRIAALEASVDFLNLIGMEAVEARLRLLATRAKQQLREIPNLNLKTNLEPELSAGVIKFKLRRMATKQAYDELWRRHRLGIALTDSGDAEGLRFSPHIYNTPDDIDRAVAAVKELA